ncbi:MAG: hypothetical protein H0V24_11335, partial [Chloroflexia bacterium]|nr:hypothetical protein [Chloroflexia bacterium]
MWLRVSALLTDPNDFARRDASLAAGVLAAVEKHLLNREAVWLSVSGDDFQLFADLGFESDGLDVLASDSNHFVLVIEEDLSLAVLANQGDFHVVVVIELLSWITSPTRNREVAAIARQPGLSFDLGPPRHCPARTQQADAKSYR